MQYRTYKGPFSRISNGNTTTVYRRTPVNRMRSVLRRYIRPHRLTCPSISQMTYPSTPGWTLIRSRVSSTSDYLKKKVKTRAGKRLRVRYERNGRERLAGMLHNCSELNKQQIKVCEETVSNWLWNLTRYCRVLNN